MVINKQAEVTKHALAAATKSLIMKRELGLSTSVALIVGNIIGSGIFVSPTGVLRNAGSLGLSLAVWVMGGVLAALGGICYVELATVIQKSGSDYAYLREGFGTVSPRLGEILGFLHAFLTVFVLAGVSRAIGGLVFAKYLIKPLFFYCEAHDDALVIKIIAALSIGLTFAFNYYSVRATARVQTVFTTAKVLALLIVIIGGLINLARGNLEFIETGFDGSNVSPGSLSRAIYSCMWAYSGWQSLNSVTEEVKNPSVTMPRAIFIALPIVTILYVLTNISYFSVLSIDEFLATEVVAVTWGYKMLGSMVSIVPLFVALSTFGATLGHILVSSSWGCRMLGSLVCIVPLFVACSTFGAILGCTLVVARLPTVAARDGLLMEFLSYVHVDRLTPVPSLLLLAFLSMIPLIFSDKVIPFIEFLGFVDWMITAACITALLVLRYTRPDAPRPVKAIQVALHYEESLGEQQAYVLKKAHILVPILYLLISLLLVVAPIIDDPSLKTLYGVVIVLSGFIFYFPFIYFKLSLPYSAQFTTFVQLVLKVAPSECPPPE